MGVKKLISIITISLVVIVVAVLSVYVVFFKAEKSKETSFLSKDKEGDTGTKIFSNEEEEK